MTSTFNYPKVDQPCDNVKLFDHQLTAIYHMEELEKNKKITLDDNVYITTNVGIYSDPTGYGKTLSVIGLIYRDMIKCKSNEIYEKSCTRSFSEVNTSIHLTMTRKNVYKQLNKTLILVNNSIITQWLEALDLFELKYYVVDAKKKIEHAIRNKSKIIVITPSMYNKLIKHTEDNIIWKRFVFDEPTNTHIPSMAYIDSKFMWLVTATPDSLRYNSYKKTHFLTSVFNTYLNHNLLRHIIVKNNMEYVKQSYKIPKTNYITHTCYQPTYHMVKNYIDSESSNMISAGNILGAIRRLGGNETSNIYELIKSRLQDDIDSMKLKYEQYVRRGNEYYIQYYKERLEALETKMVNLNCDFEERLKGECNICMDKVEKPILMPCCQNIFCGGCILEWLKNRNTCPLCRATTDISNIIYIKSENENNSTPEAKVDTKKTKLETIVDIISKNKEGKFIVFSSWNETFYNIRCVLNDNNITYKELKGHISTRSTSIREFKEGETKVLFLNSQNNAAGINLQEATDIILFHRMGMDVETQIVGRANRIGRKTELKVHYLE